MKNSDQTLKAAQLALAHGNLSLAEGLCRELLPENASSFEVLATLAQIYARFGMKTQAGEFARQAAALAPGDEMMTALSELSYAQKRIPPDTAPRFLVIKAWGQGFFSDISHVLGCCLISEITGRIPLTDWGSNSLFTDESGRDAFRFFFEPLSPLGVTDLAGIEGARFPAVWNKRHLSEPPLPWFENPDRVGALYFLNRPEQIVVCDFYISIAELAPHLPASHPMAGQTVNAIYRYLASRYLKLNDGIAAEAKVFFDTHLAGHPAVAVHLRGSDKSGEVSNLAAVNAHLLEILTTFEPPWRIFLMSDDQRLINACVERFGDRVVVAPCRRTSTNTGIHLQKGDGVALGRELLIDCYVALACHRFLGTGLSNVAAMIGVLKEWPPETCYLVGDILEQRHLVLYEYRALHTGNS